MTLRHSKIGIAHPSLVAERVLPRRQGPRYSPRRPPVDSGHAPLPPHPRTPPRGRRPAALARLPQRVHRPERVGVRRRHHAGGAHVRRARADRLGHRPRARAGRPEPSRSSCWRWSAACGRTGCRAARSWSPATSSAPAVQITAAVLLLTGTAQIWQLAVLAACHGAAEAFFRPAAGAILPQIVPAAQAPAGQRAHGHERQLRLDGRAGGGRHPGGAHRRRRRDRRGRRDLPRQRRLPRHPARAGDRARPTRRTASSRSCARAGTRSSRAPGSG